MKGCPVSKNGAMPDAIGARYPFPQVHRDGELMAQVAEELMREEGDVYCSVPFCSTVEAEAFGAQVRMGDHRTTPLVPKCPWDDPDMIPKEIPSPDSGRMGEVMKAVSILRGKGFPVILKVSGPFSTLMGLLDPKALFRTARKDPGRIETVLERISAYSLACAKEAARRDVSIISLAEPSATPDLLGPKRFEKLVSPALTRLLRDMDRLDGPWSGFLCGRLSSSMEDIGAISGDTVEMGSGRYGDHLETLRARGIRWFGGGCVAQTPADACRIRTIDVTD
ncbi:uroporphyrinogen-III decarboxylase [Dethiosulfovibrio sp. F2B]|uniref:uroporphyrinogen decarboxylase family protein n=1 Tax=Dethiosulfovibrio faecalis TaxID=2720018 RepID=UPI001F1705B1|nr:uroporphyrinogen decarboxylase family protein [Dethiosulfovibrio faecalis]MCF4152355.1 uroporphyrinogen-III decarboxylase [Dethiosulfovibrio faecalis]